MRVTLILCLVPLLLGGARQESTYEEKVDECNADCVRVFNLVAWDLGQVVRR